MNENVRGYRWFTPRELSLIIIFSALGGAASVPISYLGDVLKMIPALPFGTPKILSGLHVLWIVLSAVLVERRGAATATGVVKGLVEMFMMSKHGILVVLVSAIQGVVVEAAITVPRRKGTLSICIAAGLSSASSNLVFHYLGFFRWLDMSMLAIVYAIAFVSGFVFAGYLGKRVTDIARSLK